MRKPLLDTFIPGQIANIINRGEFAVTYRTEFGDYGTVVITLPPGGSFQIVTGQINPYVHVDIAGEPGLRPV